MFVWIRLSLSISDEISRSPIFNQQVKGEQDKLIFWPEGTELRFWLGSFFLFIIFLVTLNIQGQFEPALLNFK